MVRDPVFVSSDMTATAEDPKFYNLEEVEEIAAGHLPKPVCCRSSLLTCCDRCVCNELQNIACYIQAHDYFRTGSDTNTTLRDNRQAYQRFRLIPRVMVNVSNIDLTYTLLGRCSPPESFRTKCIFITKS